MSFSLVIALIEESGPLSNPLFCLFVQPFEGRLPFYLTLTLLSNAQFLPLNRFSSIGRHSNSFSFISLIALSGKYVGFGSNYFA